MKAIILASGPGRRLMPLTKRMPKCLIKTSDGFSILERTIRSLIENNINDIIITTGPFERKIKALMKNKYPEINITYVKNPAWRRTNYIYSLWLAKKVSGNNDIVLTHGDLIYDPKLMKRIAGENKTSVLIKKGGRLPQKDFKAEIEGGRITKIGVNFFGPKAKGCMPLYKFQRGDFRKLLDRMGKFIKEKKVHCYAEDAFNEISGEVKLYPVYYDKEICMEVDDFKDLEKAKKLKLPE